MSSRTFREIRRFVVFSLLIGVGVSVIDHLGLFHQIEAGIYGVTNIDSDSAPGSVGGTVFIMAFAVLPGVAVLLWKNEGGLLITCGCMALYYGGCWFAWRYASWLMPIAAPMITASLGIIRAYGYGLAYAKRWWTEADPLEEKAKPGFVDHLTAFRRGWTGEETGDGATKYRTFISYRREGGAATARSIQSALRMKGVEVFLDVDDLRPSHFDDSLLREIEEAPNFIVILSRGALDRCEQPDDWLRKEMAHAIRTKRNIIPIMEDGFHFPSRDDLPEDIRDVPRYHGLTFSHDFFDAMIDRIMSFLRED